MKYKAFTLFFLAGVFSHAEMGLVYHNQSRQQREVSCRPVRLDKTSLAKVPIMDQDGSGLCWAYTAATMIDAYRFSHGDKNYGHITSPLAAAAVGSRDKMNTNGFGISSSAINQLRKSYSCSHQAISKRMSATKFSLNLPAIGMNTNLKKTNDLNCNNRSTLNKNISNNLNVVSFTQRASLADLNKDLDQLCRGKSIQLNSIPVPKTMQTKDIPNFHSNPSVVASQVSSLLNRSNPQPVSISYCEDVLKNKNKATISAKGVRVGCKNRHVSAVVGQRKNEAGKCEYLIRNSYGTSCRPYAWPCENGQVWISAEALGKNVEGMEWLE